MVGRIATGKNITPTILNDSDKEEVSAVPLKKEHINLVKEGMFRVFNQPGGTGFSSKVGIPNFLLAGKSGTAQVVSLEQQKENKDNESFRDHGLFVGFAPFDQPQYAISVVIEHSGWGSKVAVPIGRKILKNMLDIGLLKATS